LFNPSSFPSLAGEEPRKNGNKKSDVGSLPQKFAKNIWGQEALQETLPSQPKASQLTPQSEIMKALEVAFIVDCSESMDSQMINVGHILPELIA